jgi:hypothetical protein
VACSSPQGGLRAAKPATTTDPAPALEDLAVEQQFLCGFRPVRPAVGVLVRPVLENQIHQAPPSTVNRRNRGSINTSARSCVEVTHGRQGGVLESRQACNRGRVHVLPGRPAAAAGADCPAPSAAAAQAELDALHNRVELIQALIPPGLEAVNELLQQELTALAGARLIGSSLTRGRAIALSSVTHSNPARWRYHPPDSRIFEPF